MWHSTGLFPTGTTHCRAQPQQRLTPLGHSHSYRSCLQGDNPVRNSQERGHVKTWCCVSDIGRAMQVVPWGAAQELISHHNLSCGQGIWAAQPILWWARALQLSTAHAAQPGCTMGHWLWWALSCTSSNQLGNSYSAPPQQAWRLSGSVIQ